MAADSDAENENVAVVASVVPNGPDSIVVSGGVASTFQARVASPDRLPAGSRARTAKVCGPSVSPL